LIDPPEKAEDWIEEIRFIPLEKNADCLLSAQMKYDINSNAIVCCNKSTINLFDLDGNHIKSFSHVGKGPGEYGLLWEVFFIPNKKEILVSDHNHGKAIIYDYNGQYLHEFKIPFQWWDIIPLDENTIALHMGKNLTPIPHQDKNYQFIKMNYKGEIDGGFMPYVNKMGPSYSLQYSKLSEEGIYVTAPPFQFNIYQLGAGQNLQKIYQFDLGQAGIDTTLINNEDFMKKTPAASDFGQGTPNLTHLGVNSNSILFYTPKPQYNKMVMRLINRKSGNQRSLVMDSLFNAGYYQGFPVFIFQTRGFSDNLVTVREALDVTEFYSKLTSDQIKKLSKFEGFKQLASLKEDDNPVLILYKLKDF
jgi:hypothetical protein